MAAKPWRRLPGKVVLFLLNLFSAIALIFEGYNQGVLGTVSGTPGFIEMAKIGHDDVVTDSTKQGGLAAAYYFGAMVGCLVGGKFHSTDAGRAVTDGNRLGGRQNRQEKRRWHWSRSLPPGLGSNEWQCKLGHGAYEMFAARFILTKAFSSSALVS